MTVKAGPAVFDLLVGWLYTQKLRNPTRHDTDFVVYQDRLCLLWILADELLMPELQNDTVAEYLKTSFLDGAILPDATEMRF